MCKLCIRRVGPACWSCTYTYVYVLVADWLPEIGFSGTRNQPKSGFFHKLGQGFFYFLPKFLAYLMIYQSFSEELWKIKKFGKKWRKALYNLT